MYRTHRATARLALACWSILIATLVCASAVGKDLGAEAKELAKVHLAKMGPGYSAGIDRHRHILYISALDDRHLRQTRALLAAYIDAQKKTLFDKPLPFNITVILPTIEDFKRIAATQKFEWADGFYEPARRCLTSIDRGEILIHEFTHALHHADYAAAKQLHPPWIREGLATLFQVSRITPSGLTPRVGLRLNTLRRALDDGTFIPLDELFSAGHARFAANSELAYAESRYVMLYLWQKGRLKSFYKRYKAGFGADPTGRRAFEAALQSRMFLIEPDFKRWVGTLQLPLGYTKAGSARLGVQVQAHRRGVKVISLIEGGAAKQAGRIRVGDLIVKFNDTEVANPAVLFAAVRSTGAMQTATIHLLRHNRPLVIQQPLGGHGVAASHR